MSGIDNVSVDESNVKSLSPPKAPALLNCTLLTGAAGVTVGGAATHCNALPVDDSNWPAVPTLLAVSLMVVTLALPLTSNGYAGVVVAIPTLPPFENLTVSPPLSPKERNPLVPELPRWKEMYPFTLSLYPKY